VSAPKIASIPGSTWGTQSTAASRCSAVPIGCSASSTTTRSSRPAASCSGVMEAFGRVVSAREDQERLQFQLSLVEDARTFGKRLGRPAST